MPRKSRRCQTDHLIGIPGSMRGQEANNTAHYPRLTMDNEAH